MSEGRARFEEACDIIREAWTEEEFSCHGKFWSYKDIAIWPRPCRQPHPPVWVPFTGSKESIEWAGRHNFSAVLSDFTAGLTEDKVGHCATSPAPHGRRIGPDHPCWLTAAFLALPSADSLTAP